MRDQETALVKLGELYRDQKCVVVPYIVWELTDGGKRNAKGLAEVITLSRAFMSSTAKAKTAKLSTSHFFTQRHLSILNLRSDLIYSPHPLGSLHPHTR